MEPERDQGEELVAFLKMIINPNAKR